MVHILDFVSNVIDAAVWPTAAIVLGLLFRPVIKLAVEELARRLARISYGKASADFGFPEFAEETAEPVAVDDQTRREIQDSPLATVVQSWRDFVWEASTILQEQGISVDGRFPIQVIRGLTNAELLDQTTYDVIDRLRTIRNQVVHERQLDMTPEGAENYFRTTTAILRGCRQNSERVVNCR